MAATQPATTAQKKRNLLDRARELVSGVLQSGGQPPQIGPRQAAANSIASTLGGAPRLGTAQQVNRLRPEAQFNYVNPLEQRVPGFDPIYQAGDAIRALTGQTRDKEIDRQIAAKEVTPDRAQFQRQQLLDQGAWATNPNSDNLQKAAGVGIGVASNFVPTTKLIQGIGWLPRVADNALQGALVGAGASAGDQLVNKGNIDPIETVKTGVTTGLIGGGLGVATNLRPIVNSAAENLPLKPVYAAGDELPIIGNTITSKTVPDTVVGQAVPDQTMGLPLQQAKQPIQQQPSPTQSVPRGLTPSIDGTLQPQQGRLKEVDKSPKTNNKNVPLSDTVTPLPEFGNKKVSNLDKAFRSTRSIIERQGKSGRKLASGLQQARDTQEIYLSELQRAMPNVTKLARKGKNAIVNKDFENFVDATQGLAQPKNKRVAAAIKEWQAVHPTIRERAVGAGLDVGDLGPNYYPHFIDYDEVFKNKSTYNEAINHLVKSGQATSPEDAIKLLNYGRDTSRNRTFGNLEASRIVDLPFYDKTPNSLIDYLNSSARRIAQTETFGADDSKALRLITKIGREGGDTEAAKNAFDIAVGAKKYNPATEAASQNIRKYVTTTRLGLGALTNVSQSVNTGVVTGHLRTFASMVKQLSPKTREFVSDAGVISDALLNDLKTQQGTMSFSGKVLGKAINKITAPGFGIVEKFNRSVAATAGRDYALRLAQKGKDDVLRKLGVTGEIKNKTLSEAQQVQAARKIVEKTQFKVDPQDLPGWADSPGGKLVAQFRTFSYNQAKFISNEVLKPLAKGDVKPAARLLAAIPLGYALLETRRVIDGRPAEEDKTKEAIAAFGKVGGAGLVFDIYNGLNPLGSKYLPSDRRVSMAVGTLGGPAAGITADFIGSVSDAVQRKKLPKDPDDLKGKVALGADDETYTDATSISRFGIRQLPIVGTAIANRVLPYKVGDGSTLTKDQKEQYDALPENEKAKFKAEKEAENATSKEDTKAREKLKASGEKSTKLPSGKVSVKIGDKYRTFDNQADADIAIGEEKYKLTGDPKQKYKNNQAKYTRDKQAGKLNEVEDLKARAALKKESITSNYSEDVADFYNLSKAQQNAYFETNREEATRLYDKAKAMDKELLDAGIIKTSKFKTSTRKASGSGRRASRGGSKGRGGSRSKSNFAVNPALKASVKQTTALRNLVKRPKIKRKTIKAMA